MASGRGDLPKCPLAWMDDILLRITWVIPMRVKCRKCGLIFDLTNKDNTLEGVLISHVNELQTMTCGAGGTHRLIGVMINAAND